MPAAHSPAICNAFWKYSLLSPVNGASLFRDYRCVATFETVFDIITTSHGQISHARDIQKNKLMNHGMECPSLLSNCTLHCALNVLLPEMPLGNRK